MASAGTPVIPAVVFSDPTRVAGLGAADQLLVGVGAGSGTGVSAINAPGDGNMVLAHTDDGFSWETTPHLAGVTFPDGSAITGITGTNKAIVHGDGSGGLTSTNPTGSGLLQYDSTGDGAYSFVTDPTFSGLTVNGITTFGASSTVDITNGATVSGGALSMSGQNVTFSDSGTITGLVGTNQVVVGDSSTGALTGISNGTGLLQSDGSGGFTWTTTPSFGDVTFASSTVTFGATDFTADVTVPNLYSGGTISADTAAVSNNNGGTTDVVRNAELWGQDYKPSCRAAGTVGDDTHGYNRNSATQLEGATNGALPAVDGVTLVINDRVLVIATTGVSSHPAGGAAAKDRGIYVVSRVGDAGTTWLLDRAADGGDGYLSSGALVSVAEGTTHAGALFMLTTPDPITVGTTGLTFTAHSSTGTSGHVQLSDGAGGFTADDGLTYNTDTDTLSVGAIAATSTSNLAITGTTDSDSGNFLAVGKLTGQGTLGDSLALGLGSIASAANGVAIGHAASASTAEGIALGHAASARVAGTLQVNAPHILQHTTTSGSVSGVAFPYTAGLTSLCSDMLSFPLLVDAGTHDQDIGQILVPSGSSFYIFGGSAWCSDFTSASGGTMTINIYTGAAASGDLVGTIAMGIVTAARQGHITWPFSDNDGQTGTLYLNLATVRTGTFQLRVALVGLLVEDE